MAPAGISDYELGQTLARIEERQESQGKLLIDMNQRLTALEEEREAQKLVVAERRGAVLVAGVVLLFAVLGLKGALEWMISNVPSFFTALAGSPK